MNPTADRSQNVVALIESYLAVYGASPTVCFEGPKAYPYDSVGALQRSADRYFAAAKWVVLTGLALIGVPALVVWLLLVYPMLAQL